MPAADKYFYIVMKILACENIRFSSLFATEDVSRGGTSATHRQKFHTDDVKSVRIRSEALIGRQDNFALLYQNYTREKNGGK